MVDCCMIIESIKCKTACQRIFIWHAITVSSPPWISIRPVKCHNCCFVGPSLLYIRTALLWFFSMHHSICFLFHEAMDTTGAFRLELRPFNRRVKVLRAYHAQPAVPAQCVASFLWWLGKVRGGQWITIGCTSCFVLVSVAKEPSLPPLAALNGRASHDNWRVFSAHIATAIR